MLTFISRVARISSNSEISVDLSPLRQAVQKLHDASLKLDEEKAKAEKDLWRIIKRWQRRHRKHFDSSDSDEKKDIAENPSATENENENDYAGFNSPWRRLRCFVKNIFGLRGYRYGYSVPSDDSISTKETTTGEEQGRVQASNRPRHRIPHRLRRAIKRVQNVNEKLSTFEAGFISEKGIKDREWYRHLGVAPGKWLGWVRSLFSTLLSLISVI